MGKQERIGQNRDTVSTQFRLDPVITTRSHYSELYRNEKSDSPEFSRISLIRRSRPHITKLDKQALVLDLGSGRQIFERQYLSSFNKPECKFVTVDIADLSGYQLLAGNSPKWRDVVSHITANGQSMPFKDDFFSFAVPNMAVDFMPEGTIGELYRVLKNDAYALVNLHHPSLIPPDLDEQIANIKRYKKSISNKEKTALEFWAFLRDNNILSSSDEEIRRRFEIKGFAVKRIVTVSDRNDTWWELDLLKAPPIVSHTSQKPIYQLASVDKSPFSVIK